MEPRRSFRALSYVDAWANRVYTARYNPLYHSGALTVGLLAVLIVTGLYLLIFYRIGTPYASVRWMHDHPWIAGWVRGLHRFASDAAVVAALVHAFRMYAQRRTWGARALAWVSGVFLLGFFFVAGWTGFVLVWDSQAEQLAIEAARILDALPIFSEPISRSFVGENPVPGAFFFVNLFAHILLPISVGVLLWVHVARVARPVLLPARKTLWLSILALTLLAFVWPPPMLPEANALRFGEPVALDIFYNFWLPFTALLPPWSVWVLGFLVLALACAVPWLTRPKPAILPAAAIVNERLCTGFGQCVLDCPYDAIEMIPRSDNREGMVAFVKAELCTRCGICIGSCPPMAIGPRGITARDQLAEVREFISKEQPDAQDVVLVGCTWSAAAEHARRTGAKFFPVHCVGAMHSSTVEFLLRGGAGGVMVVGCAEHDGRTREGVTRTSQRLFEGRRPELKARVERERIRLVDASLGEGVRLHRAVFDFTAEIAALAETREVDVDVVALFKNAQPAADDSGGASG